MANDLVEHAAGLEVEALEYPDQRGEILLEAAAAWRRAGNPRRAHEVVDQLVAEGGDDGCFARAERVELLLDDGDWPTARSELTDLASQPALGEHHCQIVAELLVEREAPEQGLAWYDRAVARVDEADLAALRGPDAAWSLTMTLVRGRRAVRERLGRPEDATDTLVVPLPNWEDDPGPIDQDDGNLWSGGAPLRLRMLVFQRPDRAEVRRRWPDVYDATDDEYYPAVELGWRELREDGTTSVQVVPATADDLVAFAECTGGSPTDSALKRQFSRTVPDSATITWPPERNAPCWCGSGTKYKKCCGRPDPTAA